MSTFMKRILTTIRWIWSHVSAAVALVLIVGALYIGYEMGHPNTESPVVAQTETTEPDSTEYTCSMHPTVRLQDPDAKCPICFMGLIPVKDDAGNEIQLTLSESAKAMSRIETAAVDRFFPTAQIRLYGNLVYDETSVARISAYFPGRIDRLFVNYIGVSVQEGDHLAEIYSPDLLAAFEELKQAKIVAEQSNNASDFLRKTANQTLTASREKLRLFGLTQKQIDQVESGTFNSDLLTIYSPIGGIVTHLAAREGDYLDTGDPIATVSNLSRLWLDLEAYESQLPLLRWGLGVTFTVEAHPGETFTGQISFIEPIVDKRTRTAAVRVAVDNTDLRLKPGMFSTAVVRAKIAADGAVISDELAGKWVSPMHPTIVKDQPGTCDICGMDMVPAESLGIVGDASLVETPMVIPRTAVLFTGVRSVVYIQIPNQEQPTYEARTVELGPRAGEFYTVRSGLNQDDQVVVHGTFRIDSAMQILAKPSMMMPDNSRDMPQTNTKPAAPEAFIESLTPLYDAYLEIQERLADDDFDGFTNAATQLASEVESIKPIGLVGEQLGIWRRSSSNLIFDANLSTIDDARIQFETVTHAILDLQSQFGHASSETLYTAYCPMAFDFEGAKWIQRGTEVNNPYFGSQMLRCGDIQETLPPVNNSPIDQHKGHMND